MSALANELGFPLFKRQGRRQVPTGEAIAVARAGHSVNTALRDVLRIGRDRLTRSIGHNVFMVGMAPAAGLLFGPLIFQTLKAYDPKASLQIVTGQAPSMIQALTNGELELVIAPKPRKLHIPGLFSEVVFTSTTLPCH
jgi:DNA-binding transcriptional LysR family regulator